MVGGAASLVTPIAAALILEVIRTFAYQYAPNAWQLVLGVVTLALIVFLPTGFAGLMRRRREVSNRSAADAVN